MTGDRDSVDDLLSLIVAVFPDRIDPAVEGALDRIGTIHTYVARLNETGARRFGLNRGEFKLLVRLRLEANERMSPGELAEFLLLSTGAMTNRLDGLEQRGLVARDRDPQDRRGVIVSITDEGRSVIDEAVHSIAHDEAEALSTLSRADLRQLNVLLRRLLVGLERDGGKDPNTPRPAPH